jgi:hypothetical protein
MRPLAWPSASSFSTTDIGSVSWGSSPNGNFVNNVVLKSSYVSSKVTDLRWCQCNPGNAVRNIDEMMSLFSDVHMDVICVSKSWFESHHSNKLAIFPGYRLLRN